MKKTDREVVSELFEKRTGVPYQNWIQAMALTKVQKQQNIKDNFLRVFVYLVLLPSGCVLSWYVLYKLLMWIFS
tara:strand:+ start:90 stop:311 length:222 start_codon:yes stop_codon:yes gene_type:complete